jgi:ABC-2 type transport system permease protein
VSAWRTIGIIARREYLATVKRKAFIFTALGTPAYFALVMSISVGASIGERADVLASLRTLAVVDSSGLLDGAARSIDTRLRLDENPFARGVEVQRFRTDVRFFGDFASAEAALRSDSVSQVLVIPPDYLETGELRRYARKSNIFSSADRGPIASWLVRGLVGGRVDSGVTARIADPTSAMELYALNREGEFELNDDRREIVAFLLPFGFAMLLGLCITVGGQYLLFGVANEKESRILESLLCSVSPEELLAGKLLGLGAAGLTLVAFWLALAAPFVGTAAVAVPINVPPGLIAVAVLYFILGYLFYASIMTGIGGITSNMREAQQFSVWFSFANFAPFIVISIILSKPNGALATALSLFPFTAATTMILRLTAPSSVVPAWQVALSLLLLGLAALFTLLFMARVFRVGLLMYGKTPSLPEILRWARRG